MDTTRIDLGRGAVAVHRPGLEASNLSMLDSFKLPMPRLAQAEDASARLLEAERAALDEIEHCRAQALVLVATAWLRAELVHKRTTARLSDLRQKMKKAAQRRQEQISCKMAALAGDMDADEAILGPVDSAIAQVTEELVGVPESS